MPVQTANDATKLIVQAAWIFLKLSQLDPNLNQHGDTGVRHGPV